MKCYVVKDLLPTYIDGLTCEEVNDEIENPALTLKFIFFFQAMKISYLPQPFLSIMDSRKQYSLGFLYSISSFLLNPPFLRDLSIVIGSVCSFLFQCILST